METKIVKINPLRPDGAKIRRAAEIIKRGRLVAFPTETVYGLGADALNRRAVKKIFRAKGRPADDPLIVHIASREDLFKIAVNIPPEAGILAKKFWPGPLTLIFKKRKIVSGEVTAGLNTVAVRMPDHAIALRLIKAAGTPVAAPSANLFGKSSPTRAEHVIKDLDGKIEMILDGGPTKIGVESTVLDLTVSPPVILRPGGLTLEKIKKFLPEVKLFFSNSAPSAKHSPSKSPGMRYRHYAPGARLILIEGTVEKTIKKARELFSQYRKQGKNAVIIATKETAKFYPAAARVLTAGSRKKISTVAKNLYKIIREADKAEVEVILAEGFNRQGLGEAIMNRLERAASKIEKV